MSNTYRAIEIANFYIRLTNSIPDNNIDNLRLNKILYYAQAWSLVRNKRPLFEDDIQEWDYGPVICDVYHTYKCCGGNTIEEAEDYFDENRLSNDELELLVDVYQKYGKYTGEALKDMTHKKGFSWEQVYQTGRNNVIAHESIIKYFEKEELDSFNVNELDIPVVKEIPAEWDSKEDAIYG